MFEFHLLHIHWYEDKWIAFCGIETPDHFGALLYVGRIWGGFWEFDLLFVKMIFRWMFRRIG